MTSKETIHQFHIPVMGLAFTVDTPLKVAKFGINSVVSIIENELLEHMREFICKNESIEYIYIDKNKKDYKAKRITAYLNTLQEVVEKQIQQVKNENFDIDSNINLYFQQLSDDSYLKKEYIKLSTLKGRKKYEKFKYLKSKIMAGSIDVNIMTKVDKLNYDKKGKVLSSEFSDALICLRGFANSNLNSSLVLSAGINPRLFSYIATFNDFIPNPEGEIKKKIIIKVSDYRSALIQGKYLAKKGVWVSEFRVESGLNCGGHAFATDGFLLGPILEEFKSKREELYNSIYVSYAETLLNNNLTPGTIKPNLKISAQGGVGTSAENKFLLTYYNLDSIGWGSPFLLVPEATNLDKKTLEDLSHALPQDFYLSHSSPLGVPFNNFKKSSSLHLQKQRIEEEKAGSPCVKKFLQFDTEFTEIPICTASLKYQKLKLAQIKETAINELEYQTKAKEILEKECLCEGLSAPALLKNNLETKYNVVSICPGPNLAYFSGIFSLSQMIDHIYGRTSILNKVFRPNLFINELNLYVKYIVTEKLNLLPSQESYFNKFKANLLLGIEYYYNLAGCFEKANLELFNNMGNELNDIKAFINNMSFQKLHHLNKS